jgi:hypothetical protein
MLEEKHGNPFAAWSRLSMTTFVLLETQTGPICDCESPQILVG